MSDKDSQSLFRSLMGETPSDETPAIQLLETLGSLIDLASDLGRPDGLAKAIDLAEHHIDRFQGTTDEPLLHYFLANAWSSLQSFFREGADANWNWEQNELERQFVHLRSAIAGRSFEELPLVRQCQIATNFGNLLSHVGRCVEALEYWERALSIDPQFAMALGNRAYGLIVFSRTLYDEGHRAVFLREAHADLVAATKFDSDSLTAQSWDQLRSRIEALLPWEYIEDGVDLESVSLGDSDAEVAYRTWCLREKLFLNPLNDLASFAVAGRDWLSVPSVSARSGEGPTYHGFYAQMKQEFISARFLYYEGITATGPHFADRGVLLHDSLDYAAYSLSLERVKAAFRMAYSLFDKIAFFLNDYLGLGIPERRVSFRTIWYQEQQRRKGLSTRFHCLDNLPLRGLFWLSKDLFEDEPGFREAIEPDARELSSLRNHAEHRYLKIHDSDWIPGADEVSSCGLCDRMAHSIGRAVFESKALRMLRHARAGLTYLSLAVHLEEQRRRSQGSQKQLTVPISLGVIDDDWKV